MKKIIVIVCMMSAIAHADNKHLASELLNALSECKTCMQDTAKKSKEWESIASLTLDLIATQRATYATADQKHTDILKRLDEIPDKCTIFTQEQSSQVVNLLQTITAAREEITASQSKALAAMRLHEALAREMKRLED